MNQDLKKSIKKIRKAKIKKLKPKKEVSKKKKIFNIVFYSVCSLIIAGSVSYLIYYFVAGNNKDNSWSGASEYISKRTLALQFIYQDSTNTQNKNYVAGTGWIINKDDNSDVYYVATNLHVAAFLTYENKTVYDYDNNSYTTYGNIVQSLVGYVNSDVGNNNTANSNSTNMITVPKPTIAYAAFNDFGNYPQVYGNSPKNFNDGHTLYNVSADFAILKYDFSQTDIANTTVNNLVNNSANIQNFENWLSTGYDADPTKFLDKPIQEVSDWQNLKYSMGGFPGNGQNLTIGTNTNYLSQNWESYCNFTLKNNQVTGYGNAGDVYSDANNGNNGQYTDPIVWVSDNSPTSPTDSSSSVYFSGYINVAYEAILSEHSRNGASGSMLMTYLDNTPYVVGIYWGTTTFSNNNNQSDTYDLGTADFFYTNSNGNFGNTNYSGYNLVQSSYTYLLENNGNLFFDPTKNKTN